MLVVRGQVVGKSTELASLVKKERKKLREIEQRRRNQRLEKAKEQRLLEATKRGANGPGHNYIRP